MNIKDSIVPLLKFHKSKAFFIVLCNPITAMTKWFLIKFNCVFNTTYVGISGGGNADPCGRPGGIGGAPPPGLVGTAGAGLPELGGGGGTLEPPDEPNEPAIKLR